MKNFKSVFIVFVVFLQCFIVGCQKADNSQVSSENPTSASSDASAVSANQELIKKLDELGKKVDKIAEIEGQLNELKNQIGVSNKDDMGGLSSSSSESVELIAKTDSNLLDASAIGDVLRVRELIEKGVENIDLKDSTGSTALHYAASNGRATIVKMLIEAGANVNELDNDKVTALNRARFIGNEETIKTLLEYKATAVEIINPLTAANKLTSTIDEVIGALNDDSIDLLKKQVALGLDVGADFSNDQTILLAAVKKGSLNIVKYLFEEHSALMRNNKNNAAIVEAFKSMRQRRSLDNTEDNLALSYIEIIKILIKELPDAVNYLDKGFSPLHIAISESRTSLIKLLLEAKADVEQKDPDGRIPLVIAITVDDHAHDHGGSHEMHGHQEEMVDLLLKAGANVHAKGIKERDALMEAIKIGNTEVAALLLDNGASPNSVDEDGVTCLHIAAYRGQVDICKKLLAGNANKDATVKVGPKKGFKPIDAAMDGKHQEIINLFKSN